MVKPNRILYGIGIVVIGSALYLTNTVQKKFETDLLAQIMSKQKTFLKETAKFLKSKKEERKHEIGFLTNELKRWYPHEDFENIVADIFKDFAEINEEYYRIRLLGKKGMETIRVDHENNQKPILVPAKNLQDKSNTNYFKKSIEFSEGQIYFSKLSLNIEKGKVEIPYRPTLRIFTPLYVNEEVKGVVGLSLNAKYFLNNLSESGMFLLNQENKLFAGNPKELYKPFSHNLEEKIVEDNKGIKYLNTNILFSPAKNLTWIIGTKKDLTEFYEKSNAHKLSLFLILAGLVSTISFIGGRLYVSEKKKIKLEAEAKYLKKLADSAEALKESEEKFRNIFEFSNDAMFVIDSKIDRIIDTNFKAVQMLGYDSIDELLSTPISTIHRNEMSKMMDFVNSVYKRGKGYSNELTCLTKDNTRLPAEISASLIKIQGYRYIITSVRDVTKRKKAEKEKQHLERQLLQSQKMESLGVMAGGIAHEFNNILTGIIGNAELSINKTVKYSDVYENVKQILKSSWRGAKLVKQILTFSRQCPDEQKTIDIEPIVKETIKLIKTAHTANIIIKCDIKKDLSCVLADPNNIHQVILNLCTNACHAMEDKGGLLELKLEEVNLNEKQLLTKLNLKPGRYIHLSVADSGYGINKDMLDKIFDPFFTTKEVGKGTGLGLSIAYGIVEKCGGKIDVYSEKGKGSIFHVYLPTTTQDKKEESLDEKIYKGTEKILVVDDEKDVRNIIKLMLTKSGYKVHSVSSGLEAIEYYKENEDIDLVLVDMKMPGLDGKDTYNALKKIDRNIKALLITGYSSHAFEDLLNIGVKGIVQKPFSERALSKIVYEAIKIKASKKL